MAQQSNRGRTKEKLPPKKKRLEGRLPFEDAFELATRFLVLAIARERAIAALSGDDDYFPSTTVLARLEDKIAEILSVQSLRKRFGPFFGKFKAPRLQLLCEDLDRDLAEAVEKIISGFGDKGRRLVDEATRRRLQPRLRELHPGKGAKQIRTMVAHRIGLRDESSVRKPLADEAMLKVTRPFDPRKQR